MRVLSVNSHAVNAHCLPHVYKPTVVVVFIIVVAVAVAAMWNQLLDVRLLKRIFFLSHYPNAYN